MSGTQGGRGRTTGHTPRAQGLLRRWWWSRCCTEPRRRTRLVILRIATATLINKSTLHHIGTNKARQWRTLGIIDEHSRRVRRVTLRQPQCSSLVHRQQSGGNAHTHLAVNAFPVQQRRVDFGRSLLR